ncbi:ASCH domain-containing protein [Rhizobium sp. SU303]|uniref:ASCH domain-containing protein n=1 Tax=Rhizobium sp. SU303 TaxID=3138065 RepID=UPI001E368249|nr:ASCH domain-containing protein [Rhizobium leguminosarum]UFW79977.1 ASCH domain-containing protein [Rhizobium leguminosarum bv. viciae]
MTTLYSGDISSLPDLALSTRQPWAHAIVKGWKDIENRKWNTRHRGWVCIHSSAFNRRNFEDDHSDYSNVVSDYVNQVPSTLPAKDLAFGAIIGVARIVDVTMRHSSPWFFGKYGFVLADQQILAEPIPVKGALGFFEWRPRMIAAPEPAARPVAAQGSLF